MFRPDKEVANQLNHLELFEFTIVFDHSIIQLSRHNKKFNSSSSVTVRNVQIT